MWPFKKWLVPLQDNRYLIYVRRWWRVRVAEVEWDGSIVRPFMRFVYPDGRRSDQQCREAEDAFLDRNSGFWKHPDELITNGDAPLPRMRALR